MASSSVPPSFPPLPTTKPNNSPSSPSSSCSDEDEYSSDENHNGVETRKRSEINLDDTIFQAFIQISGHSSPDLSKIRSFLASIQTPGALSCLICLERIRPSHPVWSCSSGCHAIFHLLCIQSWARQASNLASATRISRPSVSDNWHCPKCRLHYPKTLIPRLYFCFCGKVEKPRSDPWILPHSCGEICGRPLSSNCGHECLLLCHPGPCPPCPKLVKSHCFCGSVQDVRRCGAKSFSCTGTCSKFLACGIHHCSQKCHEGPCPPCREKGVYSCQCGRTNEERECYNCEFHCERECGRMLSCGKHVCGKGCHSGICGECPLKGKRYCPCGKVEHKGVSCDVAVPTCGSTCEKMLSCGLHRCPERCHRGPCVETCRIVVAKSCRCGSLKKEVCGRKLRCNNHKCPSPCHRGACAPCPVMVSIACLCGETHFEVPCGTEKGQKPPRCPKPCCIPSLCRHGSRCKPHRCHYGACIPCQLICDEELPCGHRCKQRCHGPKPAPNPEFTLKPKTMKSNKQLIGKPGSSCPPCQEIVSRSCFGKHIGAERLMVCSDRATFSCHNLCGNLLQCGNHYCMKPCHVVKNCSITLDTPERSQSFPLDSENVGFTESCDECMLPCQKERKPACPHPCPLPCHAGNCFPCKVLIKRSCHCGSLVNVFECTYYNNLPEMETHRVRSCGGSCHRKLPNCAHLCPETCHPGGCPSPEKCCKKVTVRCACQNLKKEWPCKDVQAAYCNAGRDPKDISKTQFGLGLIPCNSGCASKLKVVDSEIHLRKTNVVEGKETDAGDMPKRRKKRERVQKESRQISKLQVIRAAIWRCLVLILIVGAIITVVHYGYKGLFWLSDWMNKVEEKRLRKRFPSF
ncbi:NF-X1-type zinc finger protein NFXL2 isoform X2 [Tasmannia lanceolata]|uniref:NF-X1-type zinc finger protein NFXL2 isoform X2 n=1 Tax=Tasmannia lanceolata TaxID=3420 RepID=UPI004064BEE5